MKKVHYEDGVKETWSFDGDDLYVTTEEDVEALLNMNKQRQNETSTWQKFDPKKEFHQILDISMTDVMRIYEEHGIDLTGPHIDWKYVFKLIEREYPYMKTTTARLA